MEQVIRSDGGINPDGVTLVEPLMAGVVWPHIRGYIIDKVPDICPEDELLSSIERGLSQLWVYSEDREIIAAGILQAINMPVCWIYALGGSKIDTWLDCMHEVRHIYSKECGGFMFRGRKGWQRKAGAEALQFIRF